MTKTTGDPASFEAIGIVGCGLLGCSIATALKQRNFRGRIVGCGRLGANLQTAFARGYVDAVESDLTKVATSCDLFIVCTPVDRIVEDVRTLAANCRPGTLITDTGSVKETICRPLSTGLPPAATFIGAHPIAGSEKQGCSSANPDLFVNRVCVLTPERKTPRPMIDRLAGFWRSLGMTVVEMSAEAHDRALAQTSHVPHVVAAAVAASVDVSHRGLTAGGFQDTTRVAAGDPELWTAILLANANETTAGLAAVSDRLNCFLRALEARDGQALMNLLRGAKQNREAVMSGPAAEPHTFDQQPLD
jgi:cyclohexadieny/prephenate dehydrogenase